MALSALPGIGKGVPGGNKKIEKAFEHQTFTKRALRELKLLRHMDHENIIRLKNIVNQSMH